MKNRTKYFRNETHSQCDICQKPIKPRGLMLLWNDSFDGDGQMYIDRIISAHYDPAKCSASTYTHNAVLGDFMCSTGSCFGKEWKIEDDLLSFCSATFSSLSEKDRILRTIVNEAMELDEEAA